MRNRILLLVAFFAISLCVLPVVSDASSWEDKIDEAWEAGYEEGYFVGWAEAEYALEENISDAYDYGYSDGFQAGIEETEAKYKKEKQEIRDNRSSALFTICIAAGIPIVLGMIDKRKYKK